MRKITLVVLLLLTAQCFAQGPSLNHRWSLWVKTTMGSCITENYDNGTVPFTQLGVGIAPGFGAVSEWKKYHVEADIRIPASMMVELGGFDIPIDERVFFLYRVYDSPKLPFHVWVGGGLQALADIKYISALMNAGVSGSSFVNVSAMCSVKYDFATLRRSSHKLLTAHATLALPFIGVAERPGFAYMDNYTADQNLINTIFKQQETFFNPFSGLSTDLGLTFNLPNTNRIDLAYRWDYTTTAHRGIYRFDSAIHSFYVTYLFNIY